MSHPHFAPLIPLDESLFHQTVDSFAAVGVADLSWTEKIWLSLAAQSGDLQVDFGLGKYTNRGVIDGFGGIARRTEQWTVRASRELVTGDDDTGVGPLRYTVVEPFETIRVQLEENDVVPVSFDLTFHAAFPAQFEAREERREGVRKSSEVARYHQAGEVDGWLLVDGDRTAITTGWFGYRDHSWGVRQGIGQYPADIAPSAHAGALGKAPSQEMNWMPAVLHRPDGSTFEVSFYFTVVGQRVLALSGAVTQSDGTVDPIVSLDRKVEYDPVTRFLVHGSYEVRTANGQQFELEVEPISTTGFHLNPAQYGAWDGHHHGEWRGPLHVEGEHILDTTDAALVASRLWQLRDRPVRVRIADAEGFGIIESLAIGDAW